MSFNTRSNSFALVVMIALVTVGNPYAEEKSHESSTPNALSSPAPSRRTLEDSACMIHTRSPILIDFMGKGIQSPWDIGVVKAAYENIGSVKNGNVLFAGASSGSLLAAYFACWGVSPETIREAEQAYLEFDYNLINSDVRTKARALLSGRMPEFPHENILPLIDRLITRKGQKCIPERPLLIGATNGDVLDNRVLKRSGMPKLFKGQNIKDVNWENYDVSLNGQLLGKACTYFVNSAMLSILSKLDPSKRLCEFRLIETSGDLRFALLASVSEPTYFPPIREPSPEKIRASRAAPPKGRFYVGGFLLHGLAENIRQAKPETFAIGTGRDLMTKRTDNLMQRWYLMSPNRVMTRGKRWLNAEVHPTTPFEQANLSTPEELIASGYSETKRILAQQCQQR